MADWRRWKRRGQRRWRVRSSRRASSREEGVEVRWRESRAANKWRREEVRRGRGRRGSRRNRRTHRESRQKAARWWSNL